MADTNRKTFIRYLIVAICPAVVAPSHHSVTTLSQYPFLLRPSCSLIKTPPLATSILPPQKGGGEGGL